MGRETSHWDHYRLYRVRGKRSLGRRRISWLRNLREWYECKSTELSRAVASRVRITLMIVNFRRKDDTKRREMQTLQEYLDY